MNTQGSNAFFQGRSVLVTGATGFIGSHLTRALVKQGAEVTALVRASSKTDRINDLREQILFAEGDLENLASLEEAISTTKPEIIYHLAYATSVRSNDNPVEALQTSLRVNVQGSINLLQAAHTHKDTIKKFIRAGGLEEYGDGEVPYQEGQREKPISAYSASQVALTHYGQMFQQVTPIELITLRLALVYGPYQSDSFFIPSLIKHCLANKQFNMTKGTQRRDYLYIDDAIKGLLSAGRTAKLHGCVINIASSKAYAMNDIVDKICSLTDYSGIILRDKLSRRFIDIDNLVADNRHAKMRLQWQPKWRLDDGLRETVNWHKGQMKD